PLPGSGAEASFPGTFGSSESSHAEGPEEGRVDRPVTRARTLPGASPARSVGLETALIAVLVGFAYYVAAHFSLRLALVRGQVTPIWPPSGIAVAAMLVFSRRIWPGIAVAAFAVNAPLGPSILGAATIAAGNTLAPVLAVTLLDQVGFQQELRRLRDVMVFVGLAALGAMLVSATVGAATLTASGSIQPREFWPTWWVWWTGDALGVLVVAPFLLGLRSIRVGSRATWRRRAEALAL